jgi:receptor-type tyrosine-protein phosphatase F
VETGEEYSREISAMPENKHKNRYANILAYDHSRVVLSELPGDPTSNYINANWIHGYSQANSYIAAQGPNQATVGDFWRMMWETRATVIVMVTNLEEKGRVKCHRYWPIDHLEEFTVPDTEMIVTLSHEEQYPEFLIRTLQIQNGGVTRVVHHFHFVTWPDHGVPESTAGTIALLRKAKSTRGASTAPMVVHCSAGVGRTGTLIALDINLDQAAKEQTVDILGCLNTLRRQRSTMVQTEEQYIFIYRVLSDACAFTISEMSPGTLRKHVGKLRESSRDGSTNLEIEFRRLAEGASTAGRTDAGQLAVNKTKNRFQNILPLEATRVKLMPIPGVSGSDYINANFIDGFKHKNAYIATQGPLQATVNDFWRLIWEREVHSIVMLASSQESERVKSEQYWPDQDEPLVMFGEYQISMMGERNLGFVIERTMNVMDLVSETSREVRQWQYAEWPNSGVPKEGAHLLSIIEMVDRYGASRLVTPTEESIYGNSTVLVDEALRRQMKPVLIHCSTGVGRTGTVCAIYIGIKRMEEEKKLDVYSVCALEVFFSSLAVLVAVLVDALLVLLLMHDSHTTLNRCILFLAMYCRSSNIFGRSARRWSKPRYELNSSFCTHASC